MSISTASWNEHEMASLGPNRSTAQATTRPAGAVSNAADCSAISSRSRATAGSTASSASLVRLSTTLSFTSPVLSRPERAAGSSAPVRSSGPLELCRVRSGTPDQPRTADCTTGNYT